MFEWRTLDDEPTPPLPSPDAPRKRLSLLFTLGGLLLGATVLVWILYQQQQVRLLADLQTTMREVDAAANTRQIEDLLRHLDPNAPLAWHATRIDDLVKVETVWRTSTVEHAEWLTRDVVLADVRTMYTPPPPRATPLLTTTQRLGLRLFEETWRISPLSEQMWGEPALHTTPHFRLLYRKTDADLARLLSQNIESLATTVREHVGTPFSARTSSDRLAVTLTTDANGLHPSSRQPIVGTQIVVTSPALLERYTDRPPAYLAQESILWWLTMRGMHHQHPTLFERTATSLFTSARQRVLLWLMEQSGLFPNDPLLERYRRLACERRTKWPALNERTLASQTWPYHVVGLPGINPSADVHVAHAYVLADVLIRKGNTAGDVLVAAYQWPTWELASANLPVPVSLPELEHARVEWQRRVCAATTAP